MPTENSVTALIRAVNRLVAYEDQTSQAFEAELARVFRRALVEMALTLRDAGPGRTVKGAQLVKLLVAMRDALRAAGYDDLITRTAALDGLAARLTATTAGRQAASLVTGTAQRLAAAKQLLRADLLAQGDMAARALWRAAAQSLLARAPVREILTDLESALDREARHVATLFDTQVTIVSRQVSALQSTKPDDLFVYLGPVDALTREWCRARVGRVYRRDDIDAMANGQLPNAFLTGGGYNCRHRWVLLSRSSDLRALAGTDARVPEVEADLREVPAKTRKRRR